MKYNNDAAARDVIEYFENSTRDRGIMRWPLSEKHMRVNKAGWKCTFSDSVEFNFIHARYNNWGTDRSFIAMVVR